MSVAEDAVAIAQPVKQRVPFFDNAKAGLISLVVFNHLFSLEVAKVQPGRSFYLMVLLFHMPAFIFVTGMLSRPYEFTQKGAHSLGKVLWRYLAFNTISLAWGYLLLDGPAFGLNQILFHPAFALWFLLAMAWWQLALALFAVGKGTKAALVSIAIAVLISAASGYFIKGGQWLTINRVFTFLPFYVAGYRVKQMGWAMPRNRWTRVVAVLVFVLAFTALYSGVLVTGSEVLLGRAPYKGLHLVGAPAGVIRLELLAIAGLLIAAFLQLVPRSKSLLSTLGVASLSIYVWHALFVQTIKFYDYREMLTGTLPAVLLTTTALVLVFGLGPIPRLADLIAGAPFRKKAS